MNILEIKITHSRKVGNWGHKRKFAEGAENHTSIKLEIGKYMQALSSTDIPVLDSLGFPSKAT